MAQLDLVALGQRIRQARERSGLSQAELAGEIGLDRTVVTKIESGTRGVSAIELSDIAAALQTRMSSFFEEPVPALVSHRASQGVDVVDSRIDRLIAKLAEDVEFLIELAPDVLQATAQETEPRPNNRAEAEQLAHRARGLLGLTPTEPVRELGAALEPLGLLVFGFDLGPDTADAGTILLRAGGVGLVNSHMKVGRRRLAAAHELGHYLVADDYSIDWRVSTEHAGIEALLDDFARELLLPREALNDRWSSRVERHGLRAATVMTASEYRVDMATLARKLRECELIQGDEAGQIRGTSTTALDIVEHGLVVAEEFAATTLPRVYQLAILRLVRDEKLSRERALEMLHNTHMDADLPLPRARREDEIWNFVS
ncbi:helix-turn-helix domain-containing protein [Protaetiibacter mangrovi]|uniref:XRE family transcriptional regulator n=1 Tax=Protaetiibacter mangrovi TaxID=2970926 RepID=A0ABT1ZDQ7_9MICO|nr:XRE family transcriptional regulator [Protaetiibacter mangrovi]MCS0498832.1 XRE family transcriptional regulator [Protaetiibacter mangrovi]TPX02732.1 ImmA/IrrE family metallo-endopeptidase [Schumannella luteola]